MDLSVVHWEEVPYVKQKRMNPSKERMQARSLQSKMYTLQVKPTIGICLSPGFVEEVNPYKIPWSFPKHLDSDYLMVFGPSGVYMNTFFYHHY